MDFETVLEDVLAAEPELTEEAAARVAYHLLFGSDKALWLGEAPPAYEWFDWDQLAHEGRIRVVSRGY